MLRLSDRLFSLWFIVHWVYLKNFINVKSDTDEVFPGKSVLQRTDLQLHEMNWEVVSLAGLFECIIFCSSCMLSQVVFFSWCLKHLELEDINVLRCLKLACVQVLFFLFIGISESFGYRTKHSSYVFSPASPFFRYMPSLLLLQFPCTTGLRVLQF